MVKKRLTRLEMAQQLRDEAAELLRLANELDPQPGGKPDLLGQVIEAMGDKKRRKAVLAAELGVGLKQLDMIMTRENGFQMTERGWWRYTG